MRISDWSSDVCSSDLLPTLAIVDYELTLTKPLRLTADTGIDALTHAIEAYVSKHANPFSDSMAIAAMRSIWPNLRRVCEAPGDRAAREAMMVGSLQAGIRSEERRVGKGCVSACRSRGAPYH